MSDTLTQPKLPYRLTDLAPLFSEEQMDFHYNKHLVRQIDMVGFSRKELDELKAMIIQDALTLLGAEK